MKPFVILAVGVFFALIPMRAARAQSSGTRLTVEQSITLRTAGEFQFSPDGARVAMSVSESPKGAERQRHIWVLDIRPRTLRQYTFSEKAETYPRWAPDGRGLAFLSNRGEFQQIYLLPAGGGEALPLTSGKQNISAFEWSPEAKRIAFVAPETKTEAEEKKAKDKDDARVVDKDDKPARLWMLDPASGKVRQVTSSHWKISEAQWMPGGDRLIVAATDHPESDDETNRVFSVDAANGEMKEIARPRGSFAGLRVSPDGRFVSYLAGREDGPNPHDLYVVPSEGGTPRNLTAESLDRPVDTPYFWRSDGTILALAQAGFTTALYSIALDGTAKKWEALPVTATSFGVSATGVIAFSGGTAARPQEAWLWNRPAAAECVSSFNASWQTVQLSHPTFFYYRSFDGLEIQAAMYLPIGYDGHSHSPLIALVHGGPTGAWLDQVDTWAQLLTAHGFAVLAPNVRGSTGYGFKFLAMNRGDWGGGDFRDVMAGVDAVIAAGVADPERLGIGGWSYGGYMSEWAITQTNRFKAAVSGAGMSDLIAEFGTEEHPAYDAWFYGQPYEKPEGFLNSSPIIHMKNARTPTLILQGDADVIDPRGQSQQLYRALKHYGVKAELVEYPREGHGLQEEKHLLDRLRRIVAWYEENLK